LKPYSGIDLRPLMPGRATVIGDSAGASLGLSCTAAALARRPPRYATTPPGDDYEVGLRLEDPVSGGVLAYVPVAAAVDDDVRALAAGADLLCFDGTFWSDNELESLGVVAPRAREMGHVPIGGTGGSLESLPRVGAKRTVLVHINNTNPILALDSPERAQVTAAGVEIGEDGMQFAI
jgi:pyrroloquinoline quinone biosynthesis protein B